MHKWYEVYERDGKYWFDGQHGNTFGPYDSEDKAEWESTQAEATES